MRPTAPSPPLLAVPTTSDSLLHPTLLPLFLYVTYVLIEALHEPCLRTPLPDVLDIQLFSCTVALRRCSEDMCREINKCLAANSKEFLF